MHFCRTAQNATTKCITVSISDSCDTVTGAWYSSRYESDIASLWSPPQQQNVYLPSKTWLGRGDGGLGTGNYSRSLRKSGRHLLGKSNEVLSQVLLWITTQRQTHDNGNVTSRWNWDNFDADIKPWVKRPLWKRHKYYEHATSNLGWWHGTDSVLNYDMV